MKKYNIMGYKMVKVEDVQHAIRKLRKMAKGGYGRYSKEQQKLVLSAYDDVVRQLYLEELRKAESLEEIAAILEMTGDFIVYKRGKTKHDITYFEAWDNGRAVTTRRAPRCLHFDYESKAQEIAEKLGEGWSVLDTSPEEYEDNKRLLKALFGDDEVTEHD